MLPDIPCSRRRRPLDAAATPRRWPLSRVLGAAIVSFLLAAPPAAAADEGQHIVSRGQTLYTIARRYRTTVDALREANGIKPGQRIKPGLVLTLPDRGAARPSGQRRDKDDPPALGKAAGPRSEPRRAGDAPKGAERTPKAAGAKTRDTKDDAAPAGKDAGRRFARKAKRPGWVQLVRGVERIDLQLLTRQGRLMPKSLPKLSALMRASSSAKIPIDPRLATLIGMVSNHFGGRTIRVVSGYRPYSPTQYTPHSNHNHGRAIDFIVEGVPNTVVRDYCRTLRNVGVGYYPNSTFVHLDVRPVKTYWVDYSRPGEPPRYDGASGSLAADEATRDVPGAAEEEVYGSIEPHAHDSQTYDSQGGNRQTGAPPPANANDMGRDVPSSSTLPPPSGR